MQVEFESSPDDVGNATTATARLKRILLGLGTLGLILLTTVPAAYVLYVHQAWIAIWIVECGSAALVIFWLCNEPLGLPDPLLLTGRTIIRLEPDYLRVESELGWAEWDWTLVNGFEESNDFLEVQCGEPCIPAIPRSPFPDRESWDRFCTKLRGLIESGSERSAPCFRPAVPEIHQRLDPHIPSDRQVTFQASSSSLWRDDSSSYREDSANGWQYLGGAVLCASLGAGIMYGCAEANLLVLNIAAILAFILIFVATVLLLMSAAAMVLAWWFSNRAANNHQTLTITGDGVNCVGNGWMAFARWAYIGRVALDAENVVIYDTRPIPKVIVPIQAFSTAEEAEEFVRAIHTFQGAAKLAQWSKYFPPENGDPSAQPPASN